MDGIYKYFAWKEKGYWRGQELLSIPQIEALLAVHGWKKEVFASIQQYDEFGNCLRSPLYFDFDGEPERVIADVRHFVQASEFVINVTPKIFFSGNKGFHLIIDYLVEHPQCHLLVQDFARELAAVPTLDMKVYRTQSLLRIPGSPGSARGFHKIALTRKELFAMSFEEIRELSRTEQHRAVLHASAEKIDSSVMDAWLKTALAKLPSYDNINSILAHSESVGMEMTPCIQRLLTEPQPQGNRHESLFILGRFFKLCGLDLASAKAAIEINEHWALYEQQEREVTKTLKSIYFSRRPVTLGCKGASVSASLMRDNCDRHCPFSPDFPKLTVVDTKGVAHLV